MTLAGGRDLAGRLPMQDRLDQRQRDLAYRHLLSGYPDCHYPVTIRVPITLNESNHWPHWHRQLTLVFKGLICHFLA